jgi:hypothetical protein
MKKIKKSKLNFEKITVLEFKNMLSVKGGYQVETHNNGQASTRVCATNDPQIN